MKLAVVTSRDELHRLKKYWESVQWHPNVDFAQFNLVCDGRPEVLSPYVVVLGTLDEPRGLLIGRLERRTFNPSIGYFAPVAIPTTTLTVLYQGVSADAAESEATALIVHLCRFLRSGGADLVEFSNVAKDSPVFRAFTASAPKFWSHRGAVWSDHWTLNLPSEVGALRRGMRSKHRRWFERKDRELLEAFPGGVCWRWLDKFEDIPGLCADLERVASRTYQRALEAGFKDDDEHRRRFSLFAGRNQLRLQVLKIDGQIRAYWIGVIYRGVFHSSATAYDPSLAKYEPGNLLFHRLIDNLVSEGLAKLDFGLGNAFYKRRFGDSSWQEGTVRVFAPSIKGACLRLILLTSSALDSAARWFLRATGFTDRLKTLWRRRLAANNSH